MSSNVEPEEARALQELAGPSAAPARAEVLERNFQHPMRLSRAELDAARERVLAGFAPLEAFLQSLLGEGCVAEISDVAEVNAQVVLAELPSPPAVARFTQNGQPGWIVWQHRPALRAVARILGEEDGASEADERRPLSGVERRILGNLLAGVLQSVAGAFGLEPADLRVVRELYEVGSWRDGEPHGADSHRLCVSLSIEGAPLERSTLHLYLPGFQHPARDSAAAAECPALPGHLAAVPLTVRARLGACEIPLVDLLALEEGDVVPLDALADDPIELTVEGKPCARGHLGRRHGRYAVRVREVLPLPSSPTPSEP